MSELFVYLYPRINPQTKNQKPKTKNYLLKGVSSMDMLNSVNNLKVARHFKLSEFACPCCNLVMLHPKLLAKLIELRNIVERPIYITSGYRCPRYNQKIEGVVNSYHFIGLAADVKVKNINLIELLDYAEEIDFTGIGFYEKKNFLHLDVLPTKRTRWRE